MALPVTWIFHHASLPSAVDEASAHALRQTVAFTGIVVFEWLFAFQVRSAEKGVLELGLFCNRSLFLCMVIGLGL
jgi:magnesium-transporting ATPase (P-type)